MKIHFTAQFFPSYLCVTHSHLLDIHDLDQIPFHLIIPNHEDCQEQQIEFYKTQSIPYNRPVHSPGMVMILSKQSENPETYKFLWPERFVAPPSPDDIPNPSPGAPNESIPRGRGRARIFPSPTEGISINQHRTYIEKSKIPIYPWELPQPTLKTTQLGVLCWNKACEIYQKDTSLDNRELQYWLYAYRAQLYINAEIK